MKRLIFSDLHFHTWSYGSSITEEGFNSRLIQQNQSALEMINDIRELNIKYAYFTGDLFHTHGSISTQALEVASGLFKDLRNAKIKIRAISGNHDQYNHSGTINSLAFLNDEEIFGPWEDDGLKVIGLSYTKDEDKLKRFLGNISKGDRRMVLLHQGVAGIPLSSGCILDEKLTPEMIPDNVIAFTGHYHFFRKVSPKLTVVGNLTPLNWGDIDQQKGWIIWDDETNEIEQRIQKSSPNFIGWDAEKDTDNSRLQGNFVRYLNPIEPKAQPDIRAKLIKEGALTVEFPAIKAEKKRGTILRSEGITVDKLVKNVEKSCTGRRKEVGIEIRDEKYETP